MKKSIVEKITDEAKKVYDPKNMTWAEAIKKVSKEMKKKKNQKFK